MVENVSEKGKNPNHIDESESFTWELILKIGYSYHFIFELQYFLRMILPRIVF